MSYITHNKYEFNRTVCKKRKEKHTGLYIQSSPSFHIYFIGKDGDLFTGRASDQQTFFRSQTAGHFECFGIVDLHDMSWHPQ